MPTTTAYHLDAPHGRLNLVRRDQPRPEPGPHDVVLRVRAASLNRRDIMLLDGTYPVPARPGVIPVSDGVGEVIAVGAQVTRVAVGDRVAATYFLDWIDGEPRQEWLRQQHGATEDGMLASFARIHENRVVRVPDYLSDAEAATLTCAGVTAWSGMTGSRPVTAADTVLVVGSGTVALFGVQIARAVGARVIAVTSSAARAERLRGIGASDVVDRTLTRDWDARVRELTDGQGASRVLEAVGPPTLPRSMRAAGFNAQITVCGAFPAGGVTLDDRLFVGGLFTLRRLVVGSRAAFEEFTRFLDAHRVRPVIDRRFSFDAANEAYRYFRDGGPFGNVVVTLD
jgi:NADPH:quinone reductase-like Zn-dependent oxidoreductase